MVCTLSYQMYKYEHGLSAAEQRAADIRAGEVAAALAAARATARAAARAAALGDLRLRPGRAFRPRRSVRAARAATDAVTAPVRVMSSVR
jgi:hypothetical protein